MLAIFQKGFAHPPQELNSPAVDSSSTFFNNRALNSSPKKPAEILSDFHSAHPTNTFSATFSGGAALAAAKSNGHQFSLHQRLFCSLDEMYCVFVGSLSNLSSLIRQYGLCGKSTNEAMLVMEAYRTLRDRGPYPADQVLKDLDGSFAFIVYDNKTESIFAALSSDGGVPMFWGIAADGSVVISDELQLVKGSCAKSFAPFPTGCMFHSKGGLKSFEHPMNKMKAMPRVDSEGVMCGACFKVDACSKISSIPRVGSAASWTSWEDSR